MIRKQKIRQELLCLVDGEIRLEDLTDSPCLLRLLKKDGKLRKRGEGKADAGGDTKGGKLPAELSTMMDVPSVCNVPK